MLILIVQTVPGFDKLSDEAENHLMGLFVPLILSESRSPAAHVPVFSHTPFFTSAL
jgi:hypothetical protein